MELIHSTGTKQQYKNSIPSKVKLMIHNQFPGVELISPVYAGKGARCYTSPDRKVYSGSTVRVGFKNHPFYKGFSGALLYKLQKKHTYDVSCTRLLMAWEVRESGELFIVSHLIGYDKGRGWNKNRLAKLMKRHRIVADMRHGPIEDAWLMYDNTVLMARVDVIRERAYYKLEMTISEGSINEDTRRPWYIDMRSFDTRPTMEVNIHNQCTNFDWVAPKRFNIGVDKGSFSSRLAHVGYMTSFDLIPFQSTFGGVLMYTLQENYGKASDLHKSTDVRLLIAWKSEGYKNFGVFVQLIEYDEDIHWEEFTLEEYYKRYANEFSTYTGPIKETWMTRDGIMFTTGIDVDFTLRDGVLNIAISDGVNEVYTKTPEWFYPKFFDKEALNITIHNLCPDLRLTYPIYCSNNAICHVAPSRQTSASNIIEARFGIDPEQYPFNGILIYKLQRKHVNKIDNHPNSNTTSIENTKTNVHLLVAWDVGWNYSTFDVFLIECIDDFAWYEDRLHALYTKYKKQDHQGYKPNIITWLTNDGTVIKMKHDITYGSDYKLNIILSEGTEKYNMKIPMQINQKSFLIIPSSKLNLHIHNQCLNVDLVSPVYTSCGRSECNKAPDLRIYAGDTMRTDFAIYDSRYMSHGVVIYRLQRRRPHESAEIDENTTSVIHLLVVWSISESRLNAGVVLVEHDKGFEKDDLEEFYSQDIDHFRLYPDPIIETWLLNDNTTLLTKTKIIDEGLALNITISEVERNNYARTPANLVLESLELQLPPCVNILNQCLDIKLVSPIYFGNGTICPELSDQQMNIGAKMNASFEIYTTQPDFEGALLFKLQKYSDRQSDECTLTTETDKNMATHIYMVVAWKAKDTEPFAYITLIESSKEFIWNGGEFKRLYYENRSWFKKYNGTISNVWLVNDNMVLKTTFNARDLKRIPEISISISEEGDPNHAMEPLWFNTTSIAPHNTMVMTIYNQYPDIELASPVYFGNHVTCNECLVERTNIGTMIKICFGLDLNQHRFGGILVYEMQRKSDTDITSTKAIEDASKTMRLLVTWQSESLGNIIMYVLLVEHDDELVLTKDKLMRMYQTYWHSHKTQDYFFKSNWLLDDTTVLRTTVEAMKGGYRWNVFISEEKTHHYAIKPFWINSESLILRGAMNVTVCNQYSDIELVSPVYFYNHETCHKYPVERIGDGTTIKIGFQFDKLPGGILMCAVQSKRTTKSHTETIEDTSKMIQLLVVWKIENPNKPKVYAILVEHELVLDEDRLALLYENIDDQLSKCYDASKYTWLVCDNTALVATYEVVWKEGFELKTTISKGVVSPDNIKPMWIDSESLILQSAMDITINNQCSNIELTSPLYFTKDTNCFIQFPQQVSSKSRIKVVSKTGIDQNTFGGVLLYHLQGKESIIAQLLVVWGYKSNRIYLHAQLIEHEITLVWDEDRLKGLHDVYNNQYDQTSNIERWLLDNNKELQTVCESSCGGFEMNIIISEAEHQFQPQKPLWFYPNNLLPHTVHSILVHNQCSDFELTPLACFGHDVIWYRPPDQKVNTSATFRKKLNKPEFGTVLLYKLQRKHPESNTDDTSATQLLIIWSVDNKHESRVQVLFIKHDNAFTWDEDKLKRFYFRHSFSFKNDILKNTWQLDDTTILIPPLKWGKVKHTIEITISEGTKKDNPISPPYISTDITKWTYGSYVDYVLG